MASPNLKRHLFSRPRQAGSLETSKIRELDREQTVFVFSVEGIVILELAFSATLDDVPRPQFRAGYHSLSRLKGTYTPSQLILFLIVWAEQSFKWLQLLHLTVHIYISCSVLTTDLKQTCKIDSVDHHMGKKTEQNRYINWTWDEKWSNELEK